MASIQNSTGTLTVGVGPAPAVPMHVVSKPTAYDTQGHYRVARRLVPAATTLAGVLWAFRWADATRFAVIQRVRLTALQIANASAAVEDIFNLKRATGYTVSETTNADLIAPATGMQKLRSTMGDSLAIVQQSNAAAGISGGTRTLDTNPLATGSFWALVAIGTAAPGVAIPVFDYRPDLGAGEHPLVLGVNEGFLISNENAFGAAQGLALHLEVDWAEVPAF